MAPRPTFTAVNDWQAVDPGDWNTISDHPKSATETPRVGGQKVLDYTNETLSNIPGSAMKFAGNAAQAIRHPIDTATAAAGAIGGLSQKYLPSTQKNLVPQGEAAAAALKQRYGSGQAIADTVRTDPVGAMADASALVGGVAGLSRAAGASDLANAARTVSNATNPLTIPMEAAGAASRAVARPFVKSALRLPGKTERYGATPAQTTLEETKGIRPETVRASAQARVAQLSKERDALINTASQQGVTADLSKAIQLAQREIAEIKSANGLTNDIDPMLSQLTEARPGFQGSTNITGTKINPQQPPDTFQSMKQKFGDKYTKFDYAVPLSSNARGLGNRMYHEMSTELNQKVPGVEPLNQKIQGLIPASQGAQRADEAAGPIQNAVDRATRPTGGMAPALFAAHAGGLPAAVATMTVQEALSSPTIKMAIARLLHSGGKVASSPALRRGINTLGVEGEIGTPDPRFNLRGNE